MAQSPAFVGIDLGTTYSAVAYLNAHGKVEIIPNDRSQPVTPSVVMFPEGGDEDPIVGERAKRLARFAPDRVVEYVKRHMGDPTWSYRVDGQVFNAEEISAIILRELQKLSSQYLNKDVRDAVITVPAYFDDGERHATKLAGELAGFRVLGILNEPIAAALAYGLDHSLDHGRILVYDLGGGTFDVTVVDLQGGHVEVLATDGVRLLGGIDWDAKLLDYVAREFMVKYGPDPREDLKSAQRLADEVESAKRSLSTHKRAKLFIECGDVAGQIPITREKFEDLTEGLLLQTEAYTEAVLEKAELDWPDIDRIILAGGSTRMPMVRRMLRELSGKEPDTSLNPDECVGIGAAYYATKLRSDEGAAEVSTGDDRAGELLASVARDIDVKTVASHSIGIMAVIDHQRQNLVMIREQSRLPASVTRYFATHADNQVTVEIKVLEGDSTDPDDCDMLGTAEIRGLPAHRPRGSKISVTYDYSVDGILTVSARDVDSGKACQATILRGGGSDTPEQVRDRRDKLDSLYTLEGETADEVEEREQSREEDSRARELINRLAEQRREHSARESEEDSAVGTMELNRIRDELSSIAGTGDDDLLADAGGSVELLGGDVSPADDWDEGDHGADYDDSHPDDDHDDHFDHEGRDAGAAETAADYAGEDGGDAVNPWELAADQGLLDGEVADDPYADEAYGGVEDDSYEPYETGTFHSPEEDYGAGPGSISDFTGEPAYGDEQGYEDQGYEDQGYENGAEEPGTVSSEPPGAGAYDDSYGEGAYDEGAYDEGAYDATGEGHDAYADDEHGTGDYEASPYDTAGPVDEFGEGDYGSGEHEPPPPGAYSGSRDPVVDAADGAWDSGEEPEGYRDADPTPPPAPTGDYVEQEGYRDADTSRFPEGLRGLGPASSVEDEVREDLPDH